MSAPQSCAVLPFPTKRRALYRTGWLRAGDPVPPNVVRLDDKRPLTWVLVPAIVANLLKTKGWA